MEALAKGEKSLRVISDRKLWRAMVAMYWSVFISNHAFVPSLHGYPRLLSPVDLRNVWIFTIPFFSTLSWIRTNSLIFLAVIISWECYFLQAPFHFYVLQKFKVLLIVSINFLEVSISFQTSPLLALCFACLASGTASILDHVLSSPEVNIQFAWF